MTRIKIDPALAGGVVLTTVTDVVEPFTPEGGAYGEGRTMGHSHGPGHGHDHDHGGDVLAGLGRDAG